MKAGKIVSIALLLVVTAISVYYLAFQPKDNGSSSFKELDRFLRGIVYSPFYPGETGGDILPDDGRYEKHMDMIKNLGADSVSIFAEKMPAGFFTALSNSGLSYVQIINIRLYDGTDNSDLLSEKYQAKVIEHIKEVIDHNYTVGNPDSLEYFVIGYEIEAPYIANTDRLHSKVTSFLGKTLALENRRPSEIALAKLLDATRTYEKEKYGRTHLYAHIAYPAYNILKPVGDSYIVSDSAFFSDFFDIFAINLYPSYFYDKNDAYKTDNELPLETSFSRYLNVLDKEVDKPIVISELGLSTTPGSRSGMPIYGSGTDHDAAKLFRRAYRDISRLSGVKGLFFFEFMDEYWKNGEEKDDSLIHNPDDQEEWFGLYSVADNGLGQVTLDEKTEMIQAIIGIFAH